MYHAVWDRGLIKFDFLLVYFPLDESVRECDFLLNLLVSTYSFTIPLNRFIQVSGSFVCQFRS